MENKKKIKKAVKVTPKNYHTLKNKYLTRSRIMDFYKCKQYFYKKHIEGTIVGEQKEVFKIGSAVDVWLTKGKDKFLKEFVVPAKRNLKNPPKGYTELTQGQFNEVVEMCEILEVQPAYKALKKHKAQKVLTYDMPIGEYFVGMCVMPDWIHFDGDTCIITDLKTGNNVSRQKWHYHCLDYGYYLQFATIAYVVLKTHPEINNFIYRHLVIDKNPELKKPFVFRADNERVEWYINHLIEVIIPQISKEKEFLPKIVSWEDEEIFGEVNEF